MYNEQNYYQSMLSSVWPEWQIIGRLGKGSYGAVYEIQRNDLGTAYKCALKILRMESEEATLSIERAGYSSFNYDMTGDLSEPTRSSSLHQEEALEDFVRSVSTEIDVMMRLKGAPNIVNIEDYTVLREAGSRTIMIRMELLESVDQYISRRGPLGRNEIIDLGTDICTALEHCERMNILHRDIKPSNIFYKEGIGFKLGDFGISRTMSSIYSKMSMTGIGTIQYIAPEVYLGRKYDNKVDIYSLGIVLYTLLNNNRPPLYDAPQMNSGSSAERSRIHEANMRRLKGEPLPLPANANDELGEVILRACDPDPDRRFQSAGSFRNALKKAREMKPREKEGGNPSGQGFGPAGSKSFSIWKRAAIFAVVAFLLGTAVYFAVRSSGSRTEADGTGSNTATAVHEDSVQEQTDVSNRVTYTILFTNMDGTTLQREVKEGDIGELVTEYPSSIDGYTCVNESESITLSEKSTDNIIVFVYEEKTYSYTVQCIDDDSGVLLASETYEAEKYDSIVVYPPQIDGYDTDEGGVTILLTDEDSNQTVLFSYYSESEIIYELLNISYEDILHHNGHSYYVARSSSIETFWEAQNYCNELGGYLAVINDASENEALYDYVFRDLGYPSAYFGYTDDGSERDWYWADGSPAGYESWLQGQPDDANDNEDYALFYYKDTAYKWNDGDFGKDSQGDVYFIIEWDWDV